MGSPPASLIFRGLFMTMLDSKSFGVVRLLARQRGVSPKLLGFLEFAHVAHITDDSLESMAA